MAFGLLQGCDYASFGLGLVVVGRWPGARKKPGLVNKKAPQPLGGGVGNALSQNFSHVTCRAPGPGHMAQPVASQDLNNKYDQLLEDCQELRQKCTLRPPRLGPFVRARFACACFKSGGGGEGQCCLQGLDFPPPLSHNHNQNPDR